MAAAQSRNPVGRPAPSPPPSVTNCHADFDESLLSGVSYGTTWRALARARQRAPLENRFSGVADAAAATDQLTVIRSQPGFRGTSPETRLRAGSIELPCCTAEYTPAGWVHERSCALRLAAR